MPLDAERLYGLLVPTPAYEEMLAAVHGKRAEVNPPDDAVFAISTRIVYRNVTGDDIGISPDLAARTRTTLEAIARMGLTPGAVEAFMAS